MWDGRLKTAVGPRGDSRQHHHHHHGPSPFRSHTQTQNLDSAYWQDSFDSRVTGLGISNGPFRYEIRHGRTVPQLDPPSNPYDITISSVPPVAPPPRNPRRRQRPAPASESTWNSTTSRHRHHRDDEASVRPAADMYGRPAAVEISPPSSPENGTFRNGASPGDVSPIDEGADMSQQDFFKGYRSEQPRSNIPTMRRDRRQNQDATHRALRESNSRDTLRDRQNQPSQHPSAAWDSSLSLDKPTTGYGLTTIVTGPKSPRINNNAQPTLGQRFRQFAKGRAEPLDSRPPWNGASGRTKAVDPVHDDTNVAPLSIPRRGSKRSGRDDGRRNVSPSGSETSGSAVTTMRRLLPSRSNPMLREAARSASQTDLNAHTSVAQAYPSPPQIDTPIPVSQAPEPLTREAQPPNAQSLLSPHVMPHAQKAIKRKPPPTYTNQTHNPHASTSSSVYSSQSGQHGTEIPPPATAGSLTSPDDPWVQPPSRFSITTCNTTIAATPRHSSEEERPPLPTPPEQPSSMMNRRRPLAGGNGSRSSSNERIVISMKSSISNLRGDEQSRSRPTTGEPSSRRTSIMSTDKALPPAPPEIQSADDRVANLNARLDNLSHRRRNINRSIKQMTELMPMDNLLASSAVMRKREVEKQKVESLKDELSDIQREEYELGLKLHRAYKRLDQGANFEPTTLWVRRINH